MSDTERSLLDAVLENPDDDLPRLVYADYLDEHGDPKRAEFIRAQIALSRIASTSDFNSDEYASVAKYFMQIQRSWYKLLFLRMGYQLPFDETFVYDTINDQFRFGITNANLRINIRRGFVESIECETPWLFKNWKAISQSPLRQMKTVAIDHEIPFHHESSVFFTFQLIQSKDWRITTATNQNSHLVEKFGLWPNRTMCFEESPNWILNELREYAQAANDELFLRQLQQVFH